MASNEEILHAVREVQMYNLQLYKYLTTGLLENSLLPQVMVEFNEYKRFCMEFFTRIDDPNIPFIKKQEAQINVFMADVRKNDKLRRGVSNIQRSLVARCNLGQPIPMVDGNMILQDFPELCVFNTSFSVPLTILCDLVLNKYNIHNQSAIMDMMRLAEEKRISRKMLNPVPIRHSQYRPIPLSDRPATVNRHPARNITLPEAETITSTPAGLITLPEADTITSTPEKLITLPVAETITSSPAGLITLPEADTITSTPAGLITLPEADTQPETITDFQAESITDTQAEPITASQAETITETKAEFMITQTHDVTPVMSLYDASVEATANIDVNDIESSNSMDDFIKELVQPTTLCSPLHSAQADVPTNDEDTCDQLLSFLKDIPELNQDHCSLSKNSRISTAAPKCGTLSLSMQKNTMYAVPKKKDAKRDYKEYPEYTPRTDPVISWDELIVKYEKLANTNNQEQSTNQDKPSLLPEAAKHEGVSHIEEVKPAGQSQTLDVEEPPSCSQSYVVHCEQVDLGNQELPMEVTTEQCEKAKDFPSIKLLVPSPASSKDPNDNTLMKSKLSVDAPVFIPKAAGVPPNDAQNGQLYEDFQRLVSIRPSHLSGVTTAGTATKDSPADMFKDAVFKLTSNPGPLEEYLKPIVDNLKRGVTDMAIINEIIETLFQQSIAEANFRFTGAKICKYLSNELKSHHVFSNFRGMFLNRCKLDFDKREDLLRNDIERLCGLSMFFGELFLVLEIENDGRPMRIGLLRKCIEDLVHTLLSQVDDVTVKCSTQLLKLTGPALMETKDLQGNFDDIFVKIKSLEKHPSLNKTSHCLINSVLSRHEYNFGVGDQVSPQKPITITDPFNPSFQLNEPIFYNSVGQPITREEAGFSQDESSEFEGLNREEQEAFLQWEAENLMNHQQFGDHGDAQWQDNYINENQQPWSSGYTQWSSDQGVGYNQGGYTSDNSEMDDEMAAYFEMFLSDSGQQNPR